MSWTRTTTTTRHTCGGPAWGRRTAGCPRCDELAGGAEPVRWARSRSPWDEAQEIRWLQEHLASERHARHCRPVCTYGDW